MKQRGRAGALLAAVCASIAGCGGWIDLESIAESHDSSHSAGADNRVAGAATGGMLDPTGGGGGAKPPQRGGASSSSSAADAGETSKGGVGLSLGGSGGAAIPPLNAGGSAGADSDEVAQAGAATAGALNGSPLGTGGAADHIELPPVACQPLGQTGIAGVFDGVTVHSPWRRGLSGYANRETYWITNSDIPAGGFEWFVGGLDGLKPFAPPGPIPHALQLGVIWAPEESELKGEVLCFGDGYVIEKQDVWYSTWSDHVKVLGRCPGVPVEGELTFCGDDPNGECASRISGSLEGKSLPGELDYAFPGVGTDQQDAIGGEGRHFMFFVYAAGKIEPFVPGKLDSGLLVIYPEAPGFEPSVYCIGDGSGYDNLSDGRVRSTFRNLSKLGECPANAGTDSIQVCY